MSSALSFVEQQVANFGARSGPRSTRAGGSVQGLPGSFTEGSAPDEEKEPALSGLTGAKTLWRRKCRQKVTHFEAGYAVTGWRGYQEHVSSDGHSSVQHDRLWPVPAMYR